MSQIDWREYKDLKPQQKERETFIILRDIKISIDSLKKSNAEEHAKLEQHAKTTNGRVKKLELWRAMIVGALVILGSLFPYLTFAN